MTEDFPVWDEYAHVYIMGLNDYMHGTEAAQFENPLLQRIYNYARFIR